MPAFNYVGAFMTAPINRPISVLQVDMDVNAERLFVIDRITFEVLFVGVRSPSNLVKLQLPSWYSVGNRLLVGILDDSGVYNTNVTDGVVCEIVQSDFDMSQ
ncbi:hypothetical protein [Shewanella baltica]|uniref:hypothetical protein n=1 Tax=Shewanella baltica TaxID=62322 RepID=UPI0039B0E87F